MKPSRQQQLDRIHMQAAFDYATMSHANRRKTGAVIVRDDEILSYGWNGMPSKSEDECCELKDEHGQFILTSDGELITNPLVLHAEFNSIVKPAKNGTMGLRGGTIFCTLSPCVECAKMILQSGIKRVVFSELYRITTGNEVLEKYHITVEQLTLENLQCLRSPLPKTPC